MSPKDKVRANVYRELLAQEKTKKTKNYLHYQLEFSS